MRRSRRARMEVAAANRRRLRQIDGDDGGRRRLRCCWRLHGEHGSMSEAHTTVWWKKEREEDLI
jgi:hypothetical protein